MVYLCFISALLLIVIRPGHVLNKPYVWLEEHIFPYLPVSNSVLGGCALCTAFWLGVVGLVVGLVIGLWGFSWSWVWAAALNTIATVYIYQLLTND